jgi:hypothetical protein
MSAAWAVVITNRHAERSVAAALAALGYECWVPCYQKRFRGNYWDGPIRKRSRVDVFAAHPLFTGYAFVMVPWGSLGREIDRTRGVRELMRHSSDDGYNIGEPKRIRSRVIQQLREIVDMGIWEAEDGTLRYGVPERITIGQRVRTPSGVVAQVLRLDEKGRADLMAELLGTKRVIRGVDVSTVEIVE